METSVCCKKCGAVAPRLKTPRCGNCGERICAKCGCTETAACNPPCYWSRAGECSNCYFDSPADALDASIIFDPEPEELLNEFPAVAAQCFSIEQLEKRAFYFPPHWRNETSGILKKAVKSYSLHVTRQNPPPTDEQIRLIHRYFRTYIFAPVWESVLGEKLGELRRRADLEFKTCRDVGDFLTRCVAVGLGPL